MKTPRTKTVRTLIASAGTCAVLALGGCGTDDPEAFRAATAARPAVVSGPNPSQATSAPETLGPAAVTPVEAAPDSETPVAAGPAQRDPLAGAAAASLPLPQPSVSVPGSPTSAAAVPDDVNARLDRLEGQVNDLRLALERMRPATTRLAVPRPAAIRVAKAAPPAPKSRPPITASHAAARPAVAVRRHVPGLKPAAAKILPADSGNLAHAPAAHAKAESAPATPPVADDAGTSKAQAIIAAAATHADTDAAPPVIGVKQGGEAAGPAPKNVEVTLQASPAPAAPRNAATSVDGIRIGEHGNMTRLVLDLTARASFSTRLDASGTLLTVHLPGTAWRTGAASAAGNSRTVSSYAATPDGQGGTMLSLRLKRPASVSWSDTLPPSGDTGYRAVIDLTPRG